MAPAILAVTLMPTLASAFKKCQYSSRESEDLSPQPSERGKYSGFRGGEKESKTT